MLYETMFRKESITLNAIDVMNESGFHSVSTKEVAKRSGISEGTVFKYFPKKNNLIYAVLEHYSQYDDDIFNAARSREGSPREAIIFYIDSYMTYYENYPAITVITQSYDLLGSIPELEDKVKDIFTKRLGFMQKLIEEAQKVGEICKSVNSENLSEIFTSTCRGIILKWRMNSFGFPLREKTLSAVGMLLDAFNTARTI